MKNTMRWIEQSSHTTTIVAFVYGQNMEEVFNHKSYLVWDSSILI